MVKKVIFESTRDNEHTVIIKTFFNDFEIFLENFIKMYVEISN